MSTWQLRSMTAMTLNVREWFGSGAVVSR